MPDGRGSRVNRGGEMLEVEGDPCPFCDGDHPWRAKNWLGHRVVVCPKSHQEALLVVPTVEELPPPRCSRCGISQDDEPDGFLSDVRVITADGEEGHADVTQLLCGADLDAVLATLTEAGFKDHRHGGINFLEDRECPGWGKCPTPNEDENGNGPPWTGTYVVQYRDPS